MIARLLGIAMSDDASNTVSGGVRAFLGAAGFLAMMFGGYFIYEHNAFTPGAVLIAVGLVLFLLPWIGKQAWKYAVHLLRSDKVTILYVGLLVVCCIGAGFAVGQLTSRSTTSAATNTGRIVWNFEDAAAGRAYFLNMGKLDHTTFVGGVQKEQQKGELKVAGFGAHGKNTSKDPITQFSGYLRSDVTGKRMPIYVLAHIDNAPLPFIEFVPSRFEETYGIPGLADFDIATHDTPVIQSGVDGIPIEQFLKEFAPFTIVLEYDGQKFERQFTTDEIHRQINMLENSSQPNRTAAPRITRRPEIPLTQPFLPLPAPNSPTTPAPVPVPAESGNGKGN